jgi:hypothetical protein
MDDRNNPFPHDGEGGHSCTGYGCNCDEKNYGSPPNGGGCGGSSLGVILFILFIIWLIWKALS